jgi:phosphohistidine phosphatase SixA
VQKLTVFATAHKHLEEGERLDGDERRRSADQDQPKAREVRNSLSNHVERLSDGRGKEYKWIGSQRTGSGAMVRYVFLMRHAEHELDPENASMKRLSERGRKEVDQIGVRLDEYLAHARNYGPEAGDQVPGLGAVVVANSDEAKATAHALLLKLSSVKGEVCKHEVCYLAPDLCSWASPYFYHWAQPSRRMAMRTTETLAKRVLGVARSPDTNAILVVGHAPQIGWLAAHLTGDDIPISRAELLCIRIRATLLGRSGQLEWVLSPRNDCAEEDPEKKLREKIKSKMESAKLLGAVLTGLLTFIIGAPKEFIPSTVSSEIAGAGASQSAVKTSAWMSANPDLIICFGLAIAALVVGMFLFFAAYIAYDSLLMPKQFWSESRPSLRRRRWMVARPPGSAAWVLYANMLQIWTSRFIPATACAILAPVLLAYSLMVGRLWPEREWAASLGIFCVILGTAALLGWGYARRTRPILGTED